jgi:predicted acylesterase/phospholipase RssA
MRALVLSGGGMFGAWQAGAWAAIAGRFEPELIVGASVGSLNGYSIACGATPAQLRTLWLHRDLASLPRLAENIRRLTDQHRPVIPFAVVATDVLRMKARIFHGEEVTWRHLAASCAVPFVFPPVRIGDRLYTDGGLLNPLPVWAAVELGATDIVALHVLADVPSIWLKPLVRGFRAVFGYRPPLPPGVRLRVFQPGCSLGSLRDALHWKQANIERWLREGEEALRVARF